MNRKAFLLLVILTAVLFLAIFRYISNQSGVSGLKVLTTPTTSIYLNNKLVGKTPYDDKQPSGDYVIKLIPEDPTAQTSAWQGKIVLYPSVLTYVNKELGTSELKSAGEILTLEKISQSDAELAVLCQPDGASVLLDGQEKGTTPILLKDVSPGGHDVAVVSPGFNGRTVRVQTTTGYKLTVNFQLAISSDQTGTSSGVPTPSPSGSPKDQGKPLVVIKDTPTGFLRVRSGPSLTASETAQVKPGEKYVYLDEKDGWYKITLDNGKEGWVSTRYAGKE